MADSLRVSNKEMREACESMQMNLEGMWEDIKLEREDGSYIRIGNFLWHTKYSSKNAIKLLEGIPYNATKRKIDIVSLKDEEECSHLNQITNETGYAFRKTTNRPQISLMYSHKSDSYSCITLKEISPLLKALEEREFEILSYAPNCTGRMDIIYTSPEVLEKLKIGKSFKERDLKKLENEISNIEKIKLS